MTVICNLVVDYYLFIYRSKATVIFDVNIIIIIIIIII